MEKIVSQLDADGFFRCAVVADPSPLEPGVWLIPGGAIDRKPPATIEDGKRYKPWGTGWSAEAIPQPEQVAEPVTVPQSPEEIRKAEILAQLAAIDADSVRPAREIALAVARGEPEPQFSLDKLVSLENAAVQLRAELKALGV